MKDTGAIVISGAPGTGKSTVGAEISSRLDVPHALFDMDYLRWKIPAESFNMDLGIQNLAAVWPNYKVACAIVVTVVETQQDIDAISLALGGIRCHTFTLQVSDAEFRARLLADQRDSAANLAWHLQRRRELTEIFQILDTQTVDTTGMTAGEVAKHVIAASGLPTSYYST